MSKKREKKIKVHSLDYIQEKFKRNLHNVVQRYILTGATFVKIGSIYKPREDLDERQKNIGELVLCVDGIEKIIGNLEKGLSPELIVAQEVAESKRTISKVDANSSSDFYHHLHAYLILHVNMTDYKNALRDIGQTIRSSVKHSTDSGDEVKCYLKDLSDISVDKKVFQTLESEYRKLRRKVVGL